MPLRFASLMSDNAAPWWRALAAYLAACLGQPVQSLESVPWPERQRQLAAGQAQLGVVCGLQYVQAVDRGDQPGLELLAAPVMRAPRYGGQPVYFSDVVVRTRHLARCLADLRGASWACNEPTSHSGYTITRSTLARRGEQRGFFSRVIASGAHLRSLQLVLDGQIDATAIDSTVLDEELRRRPQLATQLRVIDTLGPSPIPPVVVSRALPIELRTRLREALLQMHTTPTGAAALACGHLSHFAAVSDADYDPIRHMARLADQVEPWLETHVSIR